MGLNISINIAVFHCLWAISHYLRAENIDLWAKTADLRANSLFYGRFIHRKGESQFPMLSL